MNKILSAVVAAYIAAHTELVKLNLSEKELSEYVTGQIANVISYFKNKNHANVQVFYSTSNEQVFFTMAEAWSHAQALDNRIILVINRAELTPLLEEQKAEKAAAPSIYAEAPIEVLQEICKERVIAHDAEADADALRALVEKHDAEYYKVKVDEKTLEDNPELVEQGVTLGDTIYVPKQDLSESHPENVGHLVASGNAKQIIESVKACTDLAVLNKTLAVEKNVGKRSTIIKAVEARIEELTAE